MKSYSRFIEAVRAGPVTDRVAAVSHRANSIVTRTAASVVGALLLSTGQAAALHKPQPCQIPPEFQPLMQLLHDLGSLATVAGIGLGALGIIVAGILIAAPDPNNTQRGKSVAKSSGIGVVLLLSAGMVIAFLINSLPPTLC